MAQDEDPDATHDMHPNWLGWHQYAGAARAAISAMREPTEGMIEAADKAPLPMVKLDSFSAVRALEFKAKWNAAIDAALTDPK